MILILFSLQNGCTTPESHHPWFFFVISFQRETICDALVQTGLQIFLSKFISSPQMHARGQHQIQCIPFVTSPPPSGNGNFGLGLGSEHLKPQKWDFGILADLDSGSKVGNWLSRIPPPPPPHDNLGFLGYIGPFGN